MGARIARLAVVATVAVAGCGETGGAPPNAQAIAQQLKATQGRDLHGGVRPQQLLGRPGQYVGKANFRDRRAESDGLKGLDVSEGGSIEVFESEGDAKKRATYVESIGQGGVGPFVEYDYRRGRVLLRVAGNLTPKQAREYEAAFKKVAPP